MVERTGYTGIDSGKTRSMFRNDKAIFRNPHIPFFFRIQVLNTSGQSSNLSIRNGKLVPAGIRPAGNSVIRSIDNSHANFPLTVQDSSVRLKIFRASGNLKQQIPQLILLRQRLEIPWARQFRRRSNSRHIESPGSIEIKGNAVRIPFAVRQKTAQSYHKILTRNRAGGTVHFHGSRSQYRYLRSSRIKQAIRRPVKKCNISVPHILLNIPEIFSLLRVSLMMRINPPCGPEHLRMDLPSPAGQFPDRFHLIPRHQPEIFETGGGEVVQKRVIAIFIIPVTDGNILVNQRQDIDTVRCIALLARPRITVTCQQHVMSDHQSGAARFQPTVHAVEESGVKLFEFTAGRLFQHRNLFVKFISANHQICRFSKERQQLIQIIQIDRIKIRMSEIHGTRDTVPPSVFTVKRKYLRCPFHVPDTVDHRKDLQSASFRIFHHPAYLQQRKSAGQTDLRVFQRLHSASELKEDLVEPQ